jgi:hypothetical protein
MDIQPPAQPWITYSHVVPGLQQAALRAFDDILTTDSTLDKQLGEKVHSGTSAI